MNEIERLKEDLKPFKATYIAKLAGIGRATLANFKSGTHTLNTDNYLKVRAVLDKIAKEILGA